MNNYKTIKCDQFNVSDQEYLLVELLVENSSNVNKGDILFALESSKSVIEIESEYSGHFYISRNVGENIRVGEILYIISENSLDSKSLDFIFKENKTKESLNSKSQSLKTITLKASKLIEKHNLDDNIFEEEVITEKLVLNYLSKNSGSVTNLENNISNFNNIKKIAFIGAGQGLIQALDIIYSLGNLIPTAIYDDTDDKQGSIIYNIPIVGKVNISQIMDDYKSKKFEMIIITVSTSIDFRSSIFEQLKELGVEFANLIHPSSNVGFNTTLGVGNIILAQTSVGACSVIGNNNFISAHCNIEHHNTLGNNCTFGPGVMTSGNVHIKNNIKFGTGVFIEPKVTIESCSIISSGSIITRDISENSVVYDSGIKVQTKLKK
jgi:sugar O-acyltransferase (sialic acid O-acetyltransferase NeuD family)